MPETFFHIDAFHTFKLGVGRRFVTSCLITLLTWGYFALDGITGSVEAKLDKAHEMFQAWAAVNHESPHLTKFSRVSFQFPREGTYPGGNLKGSDTTLLCKFLEHLLRCIILPTCLQEHRALLEIMLLAVAGANKCFAVWYEQGLWLSRADAKTSLEQGLLFLRGYSFLAKAFFDKKMTRFPFIPKVHMFHHLLLCIEWQIDLGLDKILNPLVFSTECDEDFIGEIARMSRRVSSRTVHIRTLQRYLVACKQYWG
jgi:hypothetical protein